MKKSLKTFLSLVMSALTATSMVACSAKTEQTAVKTPVIDNPSTVVSQSDSLEVGLTAGFPLPHAEGKVENVYEYEDELYYYNDHKANGADPGMMYTSEDDLKFSYSKLIAKESQFLPDATEEEVLLAVGEKYGTWEEWEEKYLNKFYMICTTDSLAISSEEKQEIPNAVQSAYDLRISDDKQNWELRGAVGGRAIEVFADNWLNGFTWAPEITKDPFSGLYMISGNSRTKGGNATTDYNPTTTVGTEYDKWDNLTPLLAISALPAGPYHVVTSSEYYDYVAAFNADGTPITVEVDGEAWAVYRKDLRWEEGNEYGGYVPLSKVVDGAIVNQNGVEIKNNNSMLSIGFYHEEIKKAIPHWTAEGKGLFPAIDTNMFIDSTGKLYLYFNSHSSSATRGNQIWCLPMKDLCSPDWENFTPVTCTQYSTLYYDGETKGNFSEFPLYRSEYSEQFNITTTVTNPIFGVPGYYMGTESEGTVNEASHVFEKDGYFYLTYSPFGYGNRYYSIYMAVSESPFGPFIKIPEYSPCFGIDVDEMTDYIAGTGHHAFLMVGDEMWITYHYFYNPINNKDEDGNFLGRCIGIDRIDWYDYDNVSYSALKSAQIDKDVEYGLDREWVEECYATNNHHEFTKRAKSDKVWILYGNGPTYSLQPKTSAFTGYDNVAKTANVTILEGDTATAKYANDGLVSYQYWSSKYEVVGNENTRQLKLKLSWETPQTIRNIMVYNSRDYVYAFSKVKSVVFKLTSKPTWYPDGKEYNGYAYIKDLTPDSSSVDTTNMVMRKGGSAIASFNEITVFEIIITIDARDKVGGLALTSANRYVVKLSDIFIMGNPVVEE